MVNIPGAYASNESFKITIANNKVSLIAKNASLIEILSALSKKTSPFIIQGRDRKITDTFKELTLTKSITRLVHNNYGLYTDDSGEKILVIVFGSLDVETNKNEKQNEKTEVINDDTDNIQISEEESSQNDIVFIAPVSIKEADSLLKKAIYSGKKVKEFVVSIGDNSMLFHLEDGDMVSDVLARQKSEMIYSLKTSRDDALNLSEPDRTASLNYLDKAIKALDNEIITVKKLVVQ
ncbi:hypothetical protein HXX01_03090 [Candidatus Nomurabacteria bacterium]|nr:hypothetical protein [Candidatus Nomurabacteria bacterium]